MVELGIWIFLQGIMLYLAGSYLTFITPDARNYDSGKWKQMVHREGDYWDGEELAYEFGTIGADGRPAARNRSYAGRDYEGFIERFHDGGW